MTHDAEKSIREFMEMTEAQRISVGDQAKATVTDRMPEAVPSIELGNEMMKNIIDLSEEHPVYALTVIDVMIGALKMMRSSFTGGNHE